MADKKQAVVIIHGMGEQRPLETLRTFVKSTWEMDLELSGGDAAVDPENDDPDVIGTNEWWIKPDNRPGLVELRRVTTGPLRGEKNEKHWPITDNHGRRTDFYEFYWADLVEGTRIGHVLSWASGLLFRRFNQVPPDAMTIWLGLWMLILTALIYGVVIINRLLPSGLKPLPETLKAAFSAPVSEWIGAISNQVSNLMQQETLGLIFWLIFLAIVVGIFAVALLSRIRPRMRENFKLFVQVLLFSAVLWMCWPMVLHLIGTPTVWAIIFVLFFWVSVRFLNQYFGDIARYVRATPDNIELRKNIVDRGVDLLKSLHSSEEYDRIIIVAHSQGTMIALDLINTLWSELGPHFNNASRFAAEKPLKDLDSYLAKAVCDPAFSFDLSTFRQKQRAVSACLKDAVYSKPDATQWSRPWLISDFITLGSPLSHAEFLITRDNRQLDQLVRERLLPACPPVLRSQSLKNEQGESVMSEPSFLYGADDSNQKMAHHASCFAAVRWTNIYDKAPPFFFFVGDPLSGPVSENFGSSIRVIGDDGKSRKLGQCVKDKDPMQHDCGILDICVPIIRRDAGLLRRLFTHTQYWMWSTAYDAAEPPAHIVALRSAMNLSEPPQNVSERP